MTPVTAATYLTELVEAVTAGETENLPAGKVMAKDSCVFMARAVVPVTDVVRLAAVLIKAVPAGPVAPVAPVAPVSPFCPCSCQ